MTTKFTNLQELADGLENAIDNFGVEEVLCAIETVCLQKSRHIMENYGDRDLAADWEHIQEQLSNIDTGGLE